MSHATDAEGENRSQRIRITVVIANRYAFDAEVVTGRQIKERTSSVPPHARREQYRSTTTTRLSCATAITSSPGRRGPARH